MSPHSQVIAIRNFVVPTLAAHPPSRVTTIPHESFTAEGYNKPILHASFLKTITGCLLCGENCIISAHLPEITLTHSSDDHA